MTRLRSYIVILFLQAICISAREDVTCAIGAEHVFEWNYDESITTPVLNQAWTFNSAVIMRHNGTSYTVINQQFAGRIEPYITENSNAGMKIMKINLNDTGTYGFTIVYAGPPGSYSESNVLNTTDEIHADYIKTTVEVNGVAVEDITKMPKTPYEPFKFVYDRTGLCIPKSDILIKNIINGKNDILKNCSGATSCETNIGWEKVQLRVSLVWQGNAGETLQPINDDNEIGKADCKDYSTCLGIALGVSLGGAALITVIIVVVWYLCCKKKRKVVWYLCCKKKRKDSDSDKGSRH